ncbi:MAG: response regulator, partial [Anaerolineae bacterium]|nr:response regulator [Anaerolineae bacterium]
RDIAERKAAEEALKNINKELERALLVKDEFLANMSHELRTPLNSILGFSEILLSGQFGSLSERQNKYISSIEHSGKHLLGLINDLLDLAKIEAGKLDVTLENVVISELCQSSLMFVKQMALNKNIQLSFEQDMTYPYVIADQRRLKQILVNLLSNAVKFTPNHGKVTLRVKADPAKDCVDFAVEDTGIGISREDLLRLFKPFTQVDSSLTRQHEGTGLGLALVQKLAELHGGGVTVQSEVGKGSTFTVCILGRNMIVSEEQKEKPIIPEYVVPARQSGATQGKILLAEDTDSNIIILGDYLEHKGYEMIYAKNGQEALEKAKETSPDLILMDIQMPIMDGLVATRRLRADSRFATVPIIALTALAMTGDRERCLEAGATEYVSKPANLKKLSELISNLIKANY